MSHSMVNPSTVLYSLTNLNDNHTVTIVKDQIRIGRATTNDISITNNRYLSSSHCLIEYLDGHVFISDTSSNGTLINRSLKITKNDPRTQLKSGDIIHLVYRKDINDANVAFQIHLFTTNNEQVSPFDEDTQFCSYPWIAPISPDDQQNKDENHIDKHSNTFNTELSAARKQVQKQEFAMDAEEDMEDILTCVCCQDIMSDPICLEPCLHAFCDECYTSWEAVQRTCPKCRSKVTGRKKNVVINGILEAFLKAFPHKRPVPKIKTETSKSKYQIGHDGMYLNYTQDEPMEDIDDYDNDDDEEEEEEEEEEDNHDNNAAHLQGFFAPVLGVPQAAVIRCRQCTGLAGVAVDFQCPPGQNHILCQCCFQPMPDRRDEADIHQHCEICHQFLCNMYFKPCTRQGCLGCLNRLRDFHFGAQHLTNLVNKNPVESQIVQDYLTHNQLTMQDFFILCCDRLDQGHLNSSTLVPTVPTVPSSKVVCYKCAVRIFEDLAYQFRTQMKQEEIYSATLRHRPDCHYGKRCRTQYNKLPHAQRFNHACDQTRF